MSLSDQYSKGDWQVAGTQGQVEVGVVMVVVVVEEEWEKNPVGEANHHNVAMLDQVLKVQAEAPSTQRVAQTGPDNMI